MQLVRRLETAYAKGHLENAKAACGDLLKKFPRHPKANKILGEILVLEQNFSAASHAYRTVYQSDPNQLDLLINFTFSLNQIGQYPEAEQVASKGLLKSPNCGKLCLNLAVSLTMQRKFEQAQVVLERHLAIDENFEGLFNLGNVHLQLGHHVEALDFFQRAQALNCSISEIHERLADCLEGAARFDEAIEEIALAEKHSPTNLKLLIKRALLLDKADRIESSLDILDNALNSNPRNSDLYFCRATLNRSAGNLESAIKDYEQAFELNEHQWDARFMAAYLYLTINNFEKGWHLYSDRGMVKSFTVPIRLDIPVWDGRATTKILGVVTEQGLGDEILQLSMLMDASKLVISLRVFCDERLIPLLPKSPNLSYSGKNNFMLDPNIQTWISGGDLGFILRPSKDSFPLEFEPYLRAEQLIGSSITFPPILINSLQDQSTKYVGLSWVSKNPSTESAKSISVEKIGKYLEGLEGHVFIDLNYIDLPEDREALLSEYNVHVYRPETFDIKEDLASLSALVMSTDVVVTVSNSLAHLCGGLGCNALVLVPFSYGAMWHWHNQDGVNRWYPTVEVIRAATGNDWSEALGTVRRKLQAL